MAKKKPKTNQNNLASNRKARHTYTILDKIEAGISLVGTEVKALREGRANMTDGWVDLENSVPMLKDLHIGHYSHGNQMNHGETRPRNLLLNKREILRLKQACEQKGMTIVPLEMYFKKNWVKVMIGIAKGKQAHDKRDSTKKRDAQRQIQRALKRN